MGRVNGAAVAAAGAGGLLLFAGVKGYSVPQAVTDLIRGQAPATGQHPPVITASASASGSPGATGSAIADAALRYTGHAYSFGGAPGASGDRPWDCSSFCNWVLGHDLRYQLPGSRSPGYDGATHGPTTLSYLAWSRARTTGHHPADAQAGDLCVWQTHMGIATGNGQMISALDAALGTKMTSISGGAPGGELLFVRRVGG